MHELPWREILSLSLKRLLFLESDEVLKGSFVGNPVGLYKGASLRSLCKGF